MESSDIFDKLTKSVQQKLNDALASMVNRDVDFEIKKQGIITIPEVHNLVDQSGTNVTSVYIPIMGDVVGDIFIFLPEQAGRNLADLLIGNEQGTTKIIGDFEMSALKEVGNITTGVIVTELADELKLSMMLTTPNLATDMVGALVDQVLIQYGETSNDLLAIEFKFKIKDLEIEGSFLLLFDEEASVLIKKKIKNNK